MHGGPPGDDQDAVVRVLRCLDIGECNKKKAPNHGRSQSPREGAEQNSIGRHSLSGTRSKCCFVLQGPEGPGSRFSGKQILDARALFNCLWRPSVGRRHVIRFSW